MSNFKRNPKVVVTDISQLSSRIQGDKPSFCNRTYGGCGGQFVKGDALRLVYTPDAEIQHNVWLHEQCAFTSYMPYSLWAIQGGAEVPLLGAGKKAGIQLKTPNEEEAKKVVDRWKQSISAGKPSPYSDVFYKDDRAIKPSQSNMTFIKAIADGRCSICNGEVKKDEPVARGFWTHKQCFLNYNSSNINIPDKYVPGTKSYQEPSDYQKQIRNAYSNSIKHLIIDAKAGSGKTTTLEWLICTTFNKNEQIVMAAFNKSIRAELQARMNKAKLHLVKTTTINSFGMTFIRRTYGSGGWKVESNKIKTILSGNGIGPDGKGFPKNKKDLIKLYPMLGAKDKDTKQRLAELSRRNSNIIEALSKLVDKIRQTLSSEEDYPELIEKYNINFEKLRSDLEMNFKNDPFISNLTKMTPDYNFIDLVPKILYLDIKLAVEQKFIDFVDQNWLFVIKHYQDRTGIKIVPDEALALLAEQPKSFTDVLFVDETQDLNKCQAEFALFVVGTNGRLVLVGDPFQSIYGFAGADSNSMKNLYDLLKQTVRGCSILPLSVSWRCPVTTVDVARYILKDVIGEDWDKPGKNIEPSPVALKALAEYQEALKSDKNAVVPPGVGVVDYGLENVSIESVIDKLTINDDAKLRGKEKDIVPTMILSQTNAKLISFAFKAIAKGLLVCIRGRDILGEIVKYIESINTTDNNDIQILLQIVLKRIEKIEEIEADSEENFDLEKDKLAVIKIFAEKSSSVEGLINKMDEMFSGGQCDKCGEHSEVGITICDKDIKTDDGSATCKGSIIKKEGILLSSVHKAKGLEALKIYILAYDKMGPRPKRDAQSEKSYLEETNQLIHLKYVAVTRTMFKKEYADSGLLVLMPDEDEDDKKEKEAPKVELLLPNKFLFFKDAKFTDPYTKTLEKDGKKVKEPLSIDPKNPKFKSKEDVEMAVMHLAKAIKDRVKDKPVFIRKPLI